jgi:hypothetical protein
LELAGIPVPLPTIRSVEDVVEWRERLRAALADAVPPVPASVAVP